MICDAKQAQIIKFFIHHAILRSYFYFNSRMWVSVGIVAGILSGEHNYKAAKTIHIFTGRMISML